MHVQSNTFVVGQRLYGIGRDTYAMEAENTFITYIRGIVPCIQSTFLSAYTNRVTLLYTPLHLTTLHYTTANGARESR